MRFFDRHEAATLLTSRLAVYRGKHPLVLGVPRGAVPMARMVADSLGGDLDVVLVHKLGAPGHGEFAIGAVDEAGRVLLTDAAAHATADYLAHETAAQLETLRARRRAYTPVRPALDPAGRLVILIDDGIATGATALAAIRAVRARAPARLVVATPVAPPDTVRRLEAEADEVVCLSMPSEFHAVGQFYEHFPQVSDDEVRAALAGAASAAPGPSAPR